MKFAVLVFPGSNCDIDAVKAVQDVLGEPVEAVWHTTTDVSQYDCIIIPGGFSYGDYLRCGAMASLSPVMEAVKKAAGEGKYVIGICNGFQILTESGLLPGKLMHNDHLQFRCEIAPLVVENNGTAFTRDYQKGQVINIPIAHGEGNYFADEETIARLNANNQVVFRYYNHDPNGSLEGIAGICNEQGNVLGMMPHPERAVHDLLGSADGRELFTSILKAWRDKQGA
ncbi:MAG: phosphoribosylformylglycinamidine synthase subunit PurQ [Tumebacillaceae bacterium]